MIPKLNCEYPDPEEAELFEQMVKLTTDQMKVLDGHLRRGQHAKATGCVSAEFRIDEAIPEFLRFGVFSEPGRTYRAILRFSNARDTLDPDGVENARGLAIKLLDVVGQRAVEPDDLDRTQDFLLINYPVFPFPTPAAYISTMSKKAIPFVGELIAGLHLALLEPKEFKTVMAIVGTHIASPLETKYWSNTPYWLGPANGPDGLAVKYSVVPRETSLPIPDHPERLADDYLTRAMADHLRSKEAVFDFKVQLQTDPIAMPIENVAKEWDESVSVPIRVATLTIPPQPVDAHSELAVQCEQMAFTPWHALAEHRPMGGMNRLRKAVYAASFKHRTGR